MAIIESSVEGPISSITLDHSVSPPGVLVRCMNMTVRFAPGLTASGREKAIRTPTTKLTPAQLAATSLFPGRSEQGFLGGTLIAEGTVDTAQTPTILEADFMDVEPAESVLLGTVTKNDPGPQRQLEINGVPVAMLTDSRLCSNADDPASPIFQNQFGFPISPDSIQLGTSEAVPSSAEGYFASATFHAFLFEYGGTGTLVTDPATTPQISIERASFRDEGTRVRYEARGFATTAHSAAGTAQDIELFRLDLNPATGQLEPMLIDSADLDDVETGFVRWRAEARGNKPGGFRSGAPLFLMVRNNNGNATEQTEPDIREE
ncbi:hypothetical protein [Stieleria varia]|uniref:Uncharacterized protein n=1 Tax=Stieleria varia TaxID=2528005 RepID=A0A5C6B2N8_9BACT|nr:hypothetical protein [Stieleria varia]TWU05689.1 hypothetical protein Pla52n_14040 [Stieleria varia]